MRTLRLALGIMLAAAPLAAQRRAAAPAAGSAGPWSLALGTSAGFVDVHLVGSGDITALMLPGWGSSLGALGAFPVGTIPALYMTVPIGGKWALEPSVDMHRTQINGPVTRFASDLGARADYAFGNKGWYGAAGVHIMTLKTTGSPTFAQMGLGVAGGYRFHFSGAWSGRLELSHTIMAKHNTAGIPPYTLTALSVGAMVSVR